MSLKTTQIHQHTIKYMEITTLFAINVFHFNFPSVRQVKLGLLFAVGRINNGDKNWSMEHKNWADKGLGALEEKKLLKDHQI